MKEAKKSSKRVSVRVELTRSVTKLTDAELQQVSGGLPVQIEPAVGLVSQIEPMGGFGAQITPLRPFLPVQIEPLIP